MYILIISVRFNSKSGASWSELYFFVGRFLNYRTSVSLQKSTVKEAGTSGSYVNKQGEINTTMKCTLYFISNVHFICENIC